MKKFENGDQVSWKSHGATAHGVVIKVIREECEFKGRRYHASPEEPYYEVRSDRHGTAVHEGSALTKS